MLLNRGSTVLLYYDTYEVRSLQYYAVHTSIIMVMYFSTMDSHYTDMRMNGTDWYVKEMTGVDGHLEESKIIPTRYKDMSPTGEWAPATKKDYPKDVDCKHF